MIVTVGYAGYSPSEFVEYLESLDIDTLVDVRYAPVSRRRGFSKNQLARHLEEKGIDYVHLQELGAPKELRELLKGMGDYQFFFSQYRQHLRTNSPALDRLVQLGQHMRVAVMCLEKNPGECHRHVLADQIRRQYPKLQVQVT